MLEAAPQLSPNPDAMQPLLAVQAINVSFALPAKALFARKTARVHAVADVSFTLAPGETLGIVGESGSGKTTMARAAMLQVKLDSGKIHFDGRDVTGLAGAELRRMRRHMQFVFQDPYGSLNARMTVLDAVAEPLIVHGFVKRPKDARDKIVSLLELVGLPADAMERYPHAFSGGQRQRIGIARALAISPELIIADEPVSALDVSVRAQVVNLLQELQQRLGLAYLFIAHDLAIVRHISHRIAIMYAGRIVELGRRDCIYGSPRHPYTEALLSAVLEPDPAAARAKSRQATATDPPNVIDPAPGCRYHARCPLARDRCRHETPPLTPRASDHLVACFER